MARDPEEKPVILIWKFGDGSQEEGFTVTHTYQQAGKKKIKLIMNDGHNMYVRELEIFIKTASQLLMVPQGLSSIRVGENAQYSWKILNIGNVPVRNFSVLIEIPEGLKYKNRSNGTSLSWPFSVLENQSKLINYSLQGFRKGDFTIVAKALQEDTVIYERKFKITVR